MGKQDMEITQAVIKTAIAGSASAIGIQDPIAGGALAATADGAGLLLNMVGVAITNRRVTRATKIMDDAASQAGMTPEVFWTKVCTSEQLLDNALIALEAGSKTAITKKREAYSKMLAGGFTGESEVIEATRIRLNALAVIEESHLKVLRVLSQPSSNVLATDGSDLGWKEDEIIGSLSHLKVLLPALLEPMVSAGIIWNNGVGRIDYQPFWKLTGLGEDCLKLLI